MKQTTGVLCPNEGLTGNISALDAFRDTEALLRTIQARAAKRRPSRRKKISCRRRQETPSPLQNSYDHRFYGEGDGSIMARKDHSRHYFAWPVIAFILVVMLAAFFIVLHQLHNHTRQMEFQAESLRLSIAAKEAELAALSQELQRIDSDGHIENVARQEHDFIRKGEILFKFNDPQKLEGYTVEEYQFIMDEMRD